MSDIAACLAENIRSLRKKKGLTQSELAERADISLIFLQGIESEKKWVSPSTAAALAKALGVTQARLFKDCFSEAEKQKARRQARANLDHVPTDIFNALSSTCKDSEWQWDAVRWILEGFERSR